MDQIDHVYYINLDHRADRQLEMEEWLEASGVPSEKVTRISAIYTPPTGDYKCSESGAFGCTKSHIKTIKEFLASDYNTCMILEDDYTPLDVGTFWNTVRRIITDKVDFDIVLCAYNKLESELGPTDYLRKVTYSLSTSGYILTRDFAPVLLNNYEEGLEKLIEVYTQTRAINHTYVLDNYWTRLMPTTKWYCFYPRLGVQRNSHSDILDRYVEYNC
jgi:GR25 family glycosyltransferase involved in LPS biosynthesis